MNVRSGSTRHGLRTSFVVLLIIALVSGLSGNVFAAGPQRLAPGSTFHVTGSGFSGDCDVLLFWGSIEGELLGHAAISADGTFASDVTIPQHAAAGMTSIAAYGRSFGPHGCGDLSGNKSSTELEVVGPIVSMSSPTISLAARVLSAPIIDAATLTRAKATRNGVHAIVQLKSLPAAGDLDTLGELGIVPLAYLNAQGAPGTAYLATIKNTVADQDPRFSRLVRAVHPMLSIDKIEIGLATGLWGTGPSGKTDTFILFFADVSPADADLILLRNGVAAARDGQSLTYRALLSQSQIRRLATEDAVQFLAAVPEPGQLDLDNSRALINVDSLQQFDDTSATYLGLSGLGVQISIHDSGVDQHHGDFAGRMLNTLHPPAGEDHGTHVASIAAGSGAMSNQNDDNSAANGGTAFQWRGMAPQSQIAAYDSVTGNSVLTMTDAIVTNGVDVSNHSYSYNDGQYNASMVSIDSIIRGDTAVPPRPMVFSVGNQGQAPQYGMNSGYFSLTKSCKNCIMVANLRDNGGLDGGSSHGPAPDGRLKPDLGANGRQVIAAGADVGDGGTGSSVGNSYRTKTGSSMSTPAVTGAVALLLQQYAAQFGVDLDVAPPLPSTVKAILIQTALDLAGTASGTNPDTAAATVYGAGPDWATGYGQVDAQAASDLITAKLFIEDSVAEGNVTDDHPVSVVPGQSELRVTLAWDDLAGTPNADHAAPALVNDLDLLLIGPNGEVMRPLVMPPATQFDCDGATPGTQTGTCTPGADPGPFNTVAVLGTDRLNNVEQVVVASPAAGLWQARVSVLNTDGTIRLPLGGTQRYSLAGVTKGADLSISKSASPDPAVPGEKLTYTINVTNAGPEGATGIEVKDTLPEQATFTAAVPDVCVESPTDTLTCDLGDAAYDATVELTIEVMLDSDTASASTQRPMTVTNTAVVTSTSVDPDLTNNSTSASTVVNSPPHANDDAGTTSEDTAVVIDVLANDIDADGDPLTVSAVTDPPHGTAVIDPDAKTITYTPDPNFCGPDTFGYTMTDGQASDSAIVVPVEVICNNEPPVANADSPTTNEDTAIGIEVLANDTDPDGGDVLSVISVTDPPSGAAQIESSGFVTYSPDANFCGTDTFNYTISDGNGATDVGTVTVTVTCINDAPVISPIPNRISPWGEDVTDTVTANDPDPGDTITYSLVSWPSGASVSPSGAFSWTPLAGQVGVHTIVVRATDGTASDDESFTVTVNKRSTYIVYTVETSGQYSDPVSVSAELRDFEGTPVSARTLSFTIGSRSTTAGTSVTGTASGSIVLADPAGLYSVVSGFAGDAAYSASSKSEVFTIEKELVNATFTGTHLTIASGTSAPVTLKATVAEEADGNLGNGIATLQVQFRRVSDDTLLCSSSVSFVSAGQGTATCNTPSLTLGSRAVVVSVTGASYEGPVDVGVFTVAQLPSGSAAGAGRIATDDFGFMARPGAKKAPPIGDAIHVYRDEFYAYVVKSSSLTSLSRSCTGGKDKVCTAVVEADEASTTKIELANGYITILAGTSQLRVDATDVAEPSGGSPPPDTYAVNITGGTPYSLGTSALQLLINTGNIRIPF